jgi:hypothetical protein
MGRIHQSKKKVERNDGRDLAFMVISGIKRNVS